MAEQYYASVWNTFYRLVQLPMCIISFSVKVYSPLPINVADRTPVKDAICRVYVGIKSKCGRYFFVHIPLTRYFENERLFTAVPQPRPSRFCIGFERQWRTYGILFMRCNRCRECVPHWYGQHSLEDGLSKQRKNKGCKDTLWTEPSLPRKLQLGHRLEYFPFIRANPTHQKNTVPVTTSLSVYSSRLQSKVLRTEFPSGRKTKINVHTRRTVRLTLPTKAPSLEGRSCYDRSMPAS